MPAARPAIYVASLTDYNDGILHGAWIDATLDPEEMQRQIDELLAASPTTRRTGEPAEEWAIHDHEGFGGVEIDPHESLEEIHHRAVLRLRDANTSDIIAPEIRFARRSTRKHRISPTRIRHALDHATRVAAGNPTSEGKPVVMIIGHDAQGVEIEVGALIDDNVVTVIHAMPTRYRRRSK